MNISANQLDDFCKSITFENDQKPFIISYSLSPIRILISSIKAMTFLSKSNNLQIDATYKLTMYGFLVIVVDFGTTTYFVNRKHFRQGQ